MILAPLRRKLQEDEGCVTSVESRSRMPFPVFGATRLNLDQSMACQAGQWKKALQTGKGLYDDYYHILTGSICGF